MTSHARARRARVLAAGHLTTVGETIDNPYLLAFLAPMTRTEIDTHGRGSEFLARSARRDRLTAQYAWAIPTDPVVRKLAELSPICDLGCGTGYWAKLLKSVGAEVLAVDAHPPRDGSNNWHREEAGLTRQRVDLQHFVEIQQADALTFEVPANHTLLLSWPPYDHPMAAIALRNYRGAHVIYVGESSGGCTGDAAFHNALRTEWQEIAQYEIPQWEGLHDAVTVYARKST